MSWASFAVKCNPGADGWVSPEVPGVAGPVSCHHEFTHQVKPDSSNDQGMTSCLPSLSCQEGTGRMDLFTEVNWGSRDVLDQLRRPFSGCPGLHSFCACLFPWQRCSWLTFLCEFLFLKLTVCNMLPDPGCAGACWRPEMGREHSSVCKLTFCLMEWSSQPRPGKKWLFQEMKQYL